MQRAPGVRSSLPLFRFCGILVSHQAPNSASRYRLLFVKRCFSSRQYHSSSYSQSTPSNWKLWTALPTIGMFLGYGLAGSSFRTGSAEVNPGATVSNSKSTVTLSEMPTAVYDLSSKNIDELIKQMITILGTDRVSTHLGSRVAHSSTDWSAAPDAEKDIPSMIIFPRTTEEVSKIAKACHKRRVPMIAFSGGTSLEGTLAMTTRGGVCIDFNLMDKVVALHKNDMDIVVQPGVDYVELNKQLASEGLFFPPDPGPGAKIGGMISQGCSGTNAYRYGTVKDWVLGLTIVLADGTIVKTRHRPRKSSAGYNLTQLMVGSEGTLGIITEATLKLTSKPENVQVAVISFPTTHKAVNTAVKVVQADMPVAAMELLDGFTMKAVKESGYTDKDYAELPTLFMKFSGTKTATQEQIALVKNFAQSNQCQSFVFSASDEEAESLWQARKTALWSLLAMRDNPSDQFMSADSAVPISRVADAVEEVMASLKASGLKGSILGHVGDGNFHTTVLYSLKHEAKARKIIADVQKRAIKMEGTITGEHGIGLQNRDMLCDELGPGYIDLMRQIKMAMDPLCLLNPDKIFRINFATKTG
ncbi:hypothetical protein F5884DRAFT_798888 [Xylogone sp. PMI_703]|nr:hypothetical protein F5884DRAFT_798888 [Xylogone sp. PMI_703]